MQRTARIRYWLLWWTFIGFACRAVVPVGYMPASLGDGGPFILCHGGQAGVFLRGLSETEPLAAPHDHGAAQHDHAVAEHGHAVAQHAPAASTDRHYAHGKIPADASDEHHDAQNQAWELCPIGVAVGSAAMTADLNLHLLLLDTENPAAADDLMIVSTQQPAYRSRAPPSTLLV